MDIEELKKSCKFHKWHEYEPMDAQYERYIENPSVLAAGHKINDVYHTFCDARAGMIYSACKNYGDLCEDDDLSRLNLRAMIIKHSLIDYAICLDLSWQVIWAYIQPTNFSYLVSRGYKELEKVCTSEVVHVQLNCAISQKNLEAEKISTLLTGFEMDEDVVSLRKVYNSVKHHGILYFNGFAEDSTFNFLFDKNIEFPLKRTMYDLNYIKELLLRYHGKFEDYFSKLIDIIMPKDYLDTRIDLIGMITTIAKIEKMENSKK